MGRLRSLISKETWTGLAVTALVAVALLIVVPPMLQREAPSRYQCALNQQRLARAVGQYANDWHGLLPPATGWTTYLAHYLHEPRATLRCSAARREGSEGYDYAYNPALAARGIDDFEQPTGTLVTFDASNGRLAPRHAGGAIFGFLDGSATFARPVRTAAGWRLTNLHASMDVPVGVQARDPGPYTFVRKGHVSWKEPVRRPERTRHLLSIVRVLSGVMAVVLAGLVGWWLSRGRRAIAYDVRRVAALVRREAATIAVLSTLVLLMSLPALVHKLAPPPERARAGGAIRSQKKQIVTAPKMYPDDWDAGALYGEVVPPEPSPRVVRIPLAAGGPAALLFAGLVGWLLGRRRRPA